MQQRLLSTDNSDDLESAVASRTMAGEPGDRRDMKGEDTQGNEENGAERMGDDVEGGRPGRASDHVEVQTREAPSWDEALALRKGLLLYEYDLDVHGFPRPRTGRPFGMKARPRDIGRFSVGLGVYLTGVQLFVLLTLFLSAVIAVPLVILDLVDVNFKDHFLLNANGETVECMKPYKSDNWITKMTLGSYCPDSEFSNRFDCPAECTITEPLPDFNGTSCPNLAFTPGRGQPVCDLQRIAEGSTNKFGYTPKDPPVIQLVLLLISQIFMLLWLLVLKRTQALSADQINASIVTSGDYSVLVQGLRLDSIENKPLVDYGRHYGEVANAVHVATVGKPIEMGIKLEMQKRILRELQLQAHDPSQNPGCFGGLCESIYFGLLGGFKFGLSAVEKMQALVAKTEKELEDAQQENLCATGSAIITFNYEKHAKNMLRDHQRSWLQKVIGKFTFGYCLWSDAPRVRGRKITVSRAPEPTDVWWENTWVSKRDQIKRRVISTCLTLAVISLGGLMQFWLGVAAERERESRLQAEREMTEEASPFNSAKLRVVSVLTGVVVVVLNLLIAIFVHFGSFYERWQTRSDREKWHVVKLSIFYLVNSFMVPILASYGVKGTIETWYSRGGLMEQAFYIQVTNAFLPDLITLFDPMERLNVYVFSRFARTQAMLDNLLMPHHFFLAERYASAVKTLGLAVFYMPVLPISPIIAAVGLAFSYWTDKYVALRRTQKPHNLNAKVTTVINRLLRLLPLTQMILMHQLYFKYHSWAGPVFWVGVAIWLFFALFPFTGLCRWDVAAKFSDWGTGDAPFTETIASHARPTQLPKSQEVMDAMRPDMIDDKDGAHMFLPDVYLPEMPDVCKPGYKEKVLYLFKLPEKPHPPALTLMDGQKKSTGGEATKAPEPKNTIQLPYEPGQEGGVQNGGGETDAVGDLNYQMMGFGGMVPLQPPAQSPIVHGMSAFNRPGMWAPQRQGSFVGVPYYLEQQLRQQAEAPSTSPYPQRPAPQRQPSFRPYYPAIYHD